MTTPRDPYSGLEVVPVQPPLEPTAYHSDPGIEVYHDPINGWINPPPSVLAAEADPKYAPLFARPSSRDAPELSTPYQNYLHRVYGDLPPPPRTIFGVRKKIFWTLVGIIAFLVIAGAVGGGVGAHFASKSSKSSNPENSHDSNSTPPPDTNTTTRTPNPTNLSLQNLSVSALSWTDTSNIRQIHIYHTPKYNSTHPPRILESSWDSSTLKWTVEPITDPNTNEVKPGTPIAASTGYPHTDPKNFALVKNVYFFQPNNIAVERQSPYKEAPAIWGYEAFSGLYTVSDVSSLFSYWYQDFDRRIQVITNFFQEKGTKNQLSSARYYANGTAGKGWQAVRYSVNIAEGSPIVAGVVGERKKDLRVYLGGGDGRMRVYPYDVENNGLGSVTETTLPLSPGTPICITTEDNRNYYSSSTLPECATPSRGTSLTHLILFATPDKKDLNMVSWNCSSGFVDQKSRISGLLKPGRTYLGLSATPQSQTNLSFVDQRVYVMFDEGKGEVKMEEWQVPSSGGTSGNLAVGQGGEFKLLGEVPLAVTLR
ncbi:hypothetical protein QBC38DRAFT_491053 [Podospora fimiseda]|uniref:Fucose-specific lectin n=1 Tax=Podospora fimiseda TaxID=252190 RepID=A0AAN7BGL5_9PEZI|nr:hypothetical protein QBC38DRAFT_491053 [Podospora fimiseda]